LPLNTYKRINSHVVMPMAATIAKDPAILDVVEGILGPDILIFSTEFFIKEPRSTQIVSMHQDLTYWGLGAIDGLLTAWIALSPATPKSGCMDFVKGSHKNAILPHHDSFDKNNLLSRGQEVRVDVNPEDKVAIEIHPSQMSLHHGLTIHGSGPNGSDDRRIACVVRYMRPDMSQETGEKDYAMLARGEDTFGSQTADRLLKALVSLDEGLSGYQVTRLDHSTQAATRAWRDGADIDWVVSALLHDIGDIFAPYNHDEYAASILKPFVREQCTWVVEKHGDFQMPL